MSLMLWVLVPQDISAQIACNDLVNASLDANGEYVLTPEDVVEGTLPDDAEISIDGENFFPEITLDCSDVGEALITINSETDGMCWSNLVISDLLPPVPYTHSVLTRELVGGVLQIGASDFDVASYDNCGPPNISLSQTFFTNPGVYELTFTATDASLNVATTQVFLIIQSDDPCNQLINVTLDSNGEAEVFADIFVDNAIDYDNLEISLDNINFSNTLTLTCDNIGENIIYVQGTDENGDDFYCASVAELRDLLPPNASVIDTIYIDLADETDIDTITVEMVDDGTTDNCDFDMYLDYTIFSVANWGVNIDSFTVIDEGNNVSQVPVIVIVTINGELPTTDCLESISFDTPNPWNGEMILYGYQLIELNYHDSTFVSRQPEGPFNSFLTLDCDDTSAPFTLYVQSHDDGEINECSVEVTYNDVIPPVVISEAEITLVLEGNEVELLAEDVNEGSYDACSDITIEISQTIFTEDDLGENIITFTATDAAGNWNQTFVYVYVTSGGACTLDDVQFPPQEISINTIPADVSPEGLIGVNGLLEEDVMPILPDYCDDSNMFWTYTDQVISASFGQKILRTFTVLDWYTSETSTFTQTILIYLGDQNLICNNITFIYPSEDVELFPMDVLDQQWIYNYEIIILELFFDGIPVQGNLVSQQHIGDTLTYTVTDTVSGLMCSGEVYVEIVSDCNLVESQIYWPIDVEINDGSLAAQTVTPNYMYEQLELDSIQCFPIIDNNCDYIGVAFEDLVFETGSGYWIIERQWTILDWTSEATFSFTQTITNGVAPESLICDTLPHTAPIGDCLSGHTLEDDVEWPANIEISDHRIEPADLITYSMVDTLDAMPNFYNSPDDYEADYVDFVVDLTATTLVIGRSWTVTHTNYGFTWTFNQVITVNIGDFDNRVVINDEYGNSLPDVLINQSIMTDENGYAEVEDEIVNITYQTQENYDVNVLDIIKIQRHILGIEELPQDKVLDADVNQDDKLTSLDLYLIQQALLNIDLLPWTFEDKTDEIQTVVKPKGYYLGKALGDVDNIGYPLVVNPPQFEGLSLLIDDQLMNLGETYDIPVYINKETDLTGFQVALAFDSEMMTITNAYTDVLIGTSDNFNITNDQFYYSLNEPLAADFDMDEPLFYITVQAKANTLLSLSLEDPSEPSYLATGDLELLVIDQTLEDIIQTSTDDNDNSLVKVYPNPASNYITIEGVSETDNVQTAVFDQSGRMLGKYSTSTIDVSKWHEGNYYLWIEGNGFTLSKTVTIIH